MDVDEWAHPGLRLLRARWLVSDFDSCETMQGQFSKPFNFSVNPESWPGICW